MAIDQNGQTYKLNTQSPRKELMQLFGTSHADKMYQDSESGPTHVGW